jgi:transposase
VAQRRPWEVEDGLGADRAAVTASAAAVPPPGRKRLDDRKALCGILFVLYTGIPGEILPQELGYGSGMTCWRRLRDWHAAGVWQRLHEVLLARLNAAGAIDWSRSAADGSYVRAQKGGAGRPGPARSTGREQAPSTM